MYYIYLKWFLSPINCKRTFEGEAVKEVNDQLIFQFLRILQVSECRFCCSAPTRHIVLKFALRGFFALVVLRMKNYFL